MQERRATEPAQDRRGPVELARTAPWWIRLGAAALLVDVMLLSAHIVHRASRDAVRAGESFVPFRSTLVWNGGSDGSLMELFGVLQFGSAALFLLFRGCRMPGERVLAAWGATFLVMVADDLFQLHERAGRFLDLGRLAPGLTASGGQELGGLVYWAMAASVLGTALIVLHRTGTFAARMESRALLVTAVPLGVVGAGYVLFITFRPELLDDLSGDVVDFVRMTVKLLTMTMIFIHVMRLRTYGQ